MRRLSLPVLPPLVVAALALGLSPPRSEPGARPADLVLRGGRVFTALRGAPFAEAVAVTSGRVSYVGSAPGAARFLGPKTRVIELRGRLCLPGFNDGHIHLMTGATGLGRIDLSDDGSEADLRAHIAREAAAHKERPWVLGLGWKYGAFAGGLPGKGALDEAVADRPAYMDCFDGHTGWANSRALAQAGITKLTADPPHGEIVRDASGEPTGVLKENATELVISRIPKPTQDEGYARLLDALQFLASKGITSVQDARDDPASLEDELPLFERALREDRLTLRIRAAVLMTPGHVREAIARAEELRRTHLDPLLTFGSLKGYVDGVVEAHTAALLAPDTEGRQGDPNWTPQELDAAVVDADSAGLQVYLHAIGDRAVRMALDAHEAALRAHGPRDRRGRIEHVETIDLADVPRFASLSVLASMQPLHASPDLLDVWTKNLGPERSARGFAWARLERAGARLVFGSDWPVVTPDVFRGLYCAVTRQTPDGQPPGGFHPEERLGLESALRHYTVDGAYSSFEENEKGTLEVGKRADIVVVADDLFASPPEVLLKTHVVLTLLEGREVFRATDAGPGVRP